MSQAELEHFRDHIIEHAGNVVRVHPDPSREDPRVHIIEIAPNENHNFRTLITYGISYRSLIIPREAETYGEAQKYIELAMCLPADWRLDREALDDPANTWPLDLLTNLGHYAHAKGKWLGWGHVISNGDPAEPLDPGTKLCGCVLLDPISFPEGFARIEVSQGKPVHILSVVPLYAEELRSVREYGALSFLPRMRDAQLYDVLAPARQNLCAAA